MRAGADAMIGELSETLRMALDGVRLGREISYLVFTDNGTRELTAGTARAIRLQDEAIRACERTLARADARHGDGRR